MNITHIFLAGPYNDNWTYHENCLPVYHKKLGNNVSLITTTLYYDGPSSTIQYKKESNYIDDNEIIVYRINSVIKKSKIIQKLGLYKGTINTLKKTNPDLIYVHCFQVIDMLGIYLYAKKNNIRLIVDNHADETNSAQNILSRYIVHKIIWRICAKLIENYVDTFFGVSPARVDFLINYYGIKKENIELTFMGAEDEEIELANNKSTKNKNLNKLNLSTEDFIILTGGKIDRYKRETLTLINAVRELNSSQIKLLIFGSVDNDIKDEFFELTDQKQIIYIGWINNKEIYSLIQSADICVYPGRHSVLWEQSVGSGKPSIFKYSPGIDYLDVGGNCLFLFSDSKEEIKEKILRIVENPTLYKIMSNIAIEGAKKFSYIELARHSLNHKK